MIGFNSMFGIDQVLKWNPMFNAMLNGESSPLNKPNGEYPIAKIAEQQVVAGKRAQDEILDICQKTSEQWYARRRRTAEAYVAFSHDVLHVKNPLSYMQAWQQWAAGSMERLAEDAADQIGLVTLVANRCSQGSLAAMPDPGKPNSKAPSAAKQSDSGHRNESAAEPQ